MAYECGGCGDREKDRRRPRGSGERDPDLPLGGGDLERLRRLMAGAGDREPVLSLAVAGGGDRGLRRRWPGEREGGLRHG